MGGLVPIQTVCLNSLEILRFLFLPNLSDGEGYFICIDNKKIKAECNRNIWDMSTSTV